MEIIDGLVGLSELAFCISNELAVDATDVDKGGLIAQKIVQNAHGARPADLTAFMKKLGRSPSTRRESSPRPFELFSFRLTPRLGT